MECARCGRGLPRACRSKQQLRLLERLSGSASQAIGSSRGAGRRERSGRPHRFLRDRRACPCPAASSSPASDRVREIFQSAAARRAQSIYYRLWSPHPAPLGRNMMNDTLYSRYLREPPRNRTWKNPCCKHRATSSGPLRQRGAGRSTTAAALILKR